MLPAHLKRETNPSMFLTHTCIIAITCDSDITTLTHLSHHSSCPVAVHCAALMTLGCVLTDAGVSSKTSAEPTDS